MKEISKKVLIVDDDGDIREMVSEYLNMEGFETFQADTGEAALNIIESFLPDIALLDVSLPDMTGFEICRMIKEIECLKAMEVIFMSGRTALQDRLQGFLSGGKRYICKPFDVEELVEKLHSASGIREENTGTTSQLWEKMGLRV